MESLMTKVDMIISILADYIEGIAHCFCVLLLIVGLATIASPLFTAIIAIIFGPSDRR